MATADLDRMIEFYVDVFEAEITMDLTEGPVRHAFIDVGGGTVLHPFQIEGRPADATGGEMFRRGHLDHFALDVEDPESFETLRSRLVECGASDGTATDFGPVRTVAYRDPDGWWGEIAHWEPGPPRPLDEAVVEEYSG